MAGAKLKVRRYPGRPITNNSPRARARRVARRALTASGICGCGAPADRGVQCEACSARNAESLRVLAVTRKAAGLCRGVRLAIAGPSQVHDVRSQARVAPVAIAEAQAGRERVPQGTACRVQGGVPSSDHPSRGVTMQTKDITDATILDALAAVRGKHGVPRWSALWDVKQQLPEVHPKLVLSKLRSMIKRRVIGGCGCGCRGDFELIEQPTESQASADPCPVQRMLDWARADHDKLHHNRQAVSEPRTFRVLLGQSRVRRSVRDSWPASLPWAMVEPWRAQVESNHGQTLERLDKRGGLAPEELWLAAHGYSLRRRHDITEIVAGEWLHRLVAARSEISPRTADELEWGNAGPCQRCQSPRVASVRTKCSDRCYVSIGEPHHDGHTPGYVPEDMGIGKDKYLEIHLCLECGQAQGAWPLPATALESRLQT